MFFLFADFQVAEFPRPKETFWETKFQRSVKRLANIPKRLPQWVTST